MKILVCGSRTFNDYGKMESALLNLPFIGGIISGGADGADKLAELYASNHSVHNLVVRADWKNEGKSAGIKRNLKMLDMKPDLVVAFWDGKSRGTKHTLTEAMKRKIPTLTVYF